MITSEEPKRPCFEPLQIAGRLRSELRAPATASDTEKWWQLFCELEMALLVGGSGSSRERNVVSRLRSGLTQVVSAIESGQVPDFARATAPLASLEASLKRHQSKRPARPGAGEPD